jgi:type II secretory pathway component PulK
MPCEGVKVGDGAFWIICPNWNDSRLPAYGLVDEASKINLNTAPEPMLALLPDATPDIACSIVDWRSRAKPSPTETPDGGIGAESDYYLLANSPYQCKNAPLETVEELLLVKEMTTDILYGRDKNHNGVLDPGDASDGNGLLDYGMAPFVTVYSAEPSSSVAHTSAASASGTIASSPSLVNVKNSNRKPLTDLINAQLGGSARAVLRAIARNPAPFTSVMDFYVKSGMSQQDFAKIAPYLFSGAVSGLININTAPSQVLECLTGLTGAGAFTDEDVSNLIANRSQGGIDNSNLAWVTAAITDKSKLARIGPYITTRSYQFSADIVSVAGNGRAFRRCRVVVDASVSPPNVAYRQDLTHLGWPLPEAILTTLRAGKGIDQAVAASRNQTFTLGVR